MEFRCQLLARLEEFWKARYKTCLDLRHEIRVYIKGTLEPFNMGSHL